MDEPQELTVAGLAHDLNNVFETISEAAELLAGDPKWKKLAGTLHRSVKHGARIVESLTERAKEPAAGPQSPEAGGGDPTMGDEPPLGLEEVIDNAMHFAEDALQFQGIRIQWEKRLPGGLRLPGSAPAWERVFANLFLNAAQAAPEAPTVHVEAGEAAGVLTITVRDEGPGIAPSILGRIFEPHVSTKKPRSSKGRSGLGLHIVSTLVREQGGTIRAANGRPRGAIFTIELPR